MRTSITGFLLAFFVTLTGVAQTFTVDGLNYQVTSTSPNEVQLTGGTPATTDLLIPASVADPNTSVSYSVTAITDEAFRSRQLTSVVIPDTVLIIGEGAFRRNDLSSFTIGSSVTTIGNLAFADNTDQNTILSRAVIPPTLGTSAIAQRAQTDLTVPEGSELDYVINGWNGFRTLNGQDPVNFQVFEIEGITYKITSFETNTVETFDTTNTGAITIPSTVSNDGETYFVTSIGLNSFREKNITSVEIPTSVTTIGDNAFRDSQLASVVIPESISNLGGAAFRGNNLTSIVIPESITNINGGAFRDNDLTSVVIPNSVTSIGNFAFAENNLPSVILPSSVTTLGNSVFQNNLDLITVTSNNPVPPELGENVFFNTGSEKVLFIPGESVQEYLDAGWTFFSIINGPLTIGTAFAIDGLIYQVTTIDPDTVAVIDNINTVAVEIPAIATIGELQFNVTSIGEDAFRDNGLTSIVIPEGVATLGRSSFRNNALTNVKIPASVTNIDAGAFRNNDLTSILIPVNVVNVGASAFRDNTALKRIISENPDPPTRADFSFANTASGKELFIPEGTTQEYLDARWNFTATVTEASNALQLKVYLQGAGLDPNTGEENLMRDDLRVAGVIPTNSPYGDGATTEITLFNETGTNAIVDWVFVELRDAADSATVIEGGSALLQRDGDLVGIDGLSPFAFTLLPGDYFVTITHRNHLGIMTVTANTLSSVVTFIDFTTDSNLIRGDINATTTLPNGNLAMVGGDLDANAQVQNTDLSSLVLLLGGSGYNAADLDMNGQIQNTDINNLLNINLGRGQQF